MTATETRRTVRLFLRVVALQSVAILALLGLVLHVGAQSSRDIRAAQLAGCERSKLDRRANAEGWRTAEVARRASGTPSDLEAARRYDLIADSLDAGARIDCARAFPPSRLLPR